VPHLEKCAKLRKMGQNFKNQLTLGKMLLEKSALGKMLYNWRSATLGKNAGCRT